MIEGLDKLVSQLKKVKNVDPHDMLAGALVLQKHSMINAPVRTGFLRNSHESRETSTGAEMAVTALYAWYQELKKGYVRKAIDENGEEIVKAVKEQVEKDIRKKI
jgi:hypothetical protein